MTTLGTASEDGCEDCGHQPGCGCECCTWSGEPVLSGDIGWVDIRPPQRWFLWTE